MPRFRKLFGNAASISMAFLIANQLHSDAASGSQLAGTNIEVSASSGKYKVRNVAAYPLQYSTDTPEGAEPEHLEFKFDGSNAILNVYSIKDVASPQFKKKFPPFPGCTSDVSLMLKQKPKTIKEMPLIPWIEGESEICSHVEYGSSKSGDVSYVRLLQFFQQDASEITNEGLLYCAQGLSKDKKFYISLVCPVRCPKLQNKPSSEKWDQKRWKEFAKNGKTYYANINKTLAATTDSAFTPALTDVDKILNNLTISPIRSSSRSDMRK